MCKEKICYIIIYTEISRNTKNDYLENTSNNFIGLDVLLTFMYIL